jgi:uncharacterized protein (DUF302 family)
MVNPRQGGTIMTINALCWAAALMLAGIPGIASAADAGLISLPSKSSAATTLQRFEDAIKARADQGWMVFTELDHAAAAEKHGLKLLPRTVVVFGNPRLGTANMAKVAELAIDLPLKALVWQDEAGTVWLTYNSGPYVMGTLYPRHGVTAPPGAVDGLAQFLAAVAAEATR